jgi:mannose-6-phosphate isomerase-like protein (cupin superfamily)
LIAVHESARDWETWPDELLAERGCVLWRTLVSGDLTPSSDLTLGVARIAPGEELRAHRHAPAELYFVLTGEALVTVDGDARTLGPGTAVFIPGNAVHSCANRGSVELRFAYVLAADSFGEVEYLFA